MKRKRFSDEQIVGYPAGSGWREHRARGLSTARHHGDPVLSLAREVRRDAEGRDPAAEAARG